MPVDTQRSNPATKRHSLGMELLVTGLLIITGVAVGLTSIIKSKRTDESDNVFQHTTAPPTISPTFAFQTEVLDFFPSYTIASLQNPDTAQSKALRWLLEDPYLLQYVDQEWRVRQRFALATFYFATGGSNWTQNDHWLDYSHHECLWYSADDFAFPVPWFTTYESQYRNPCEQPNPVESNRSDPSTSNKETQSYRNLWLWRNNLLATGGLPEELFWLTSLQSLSLFGANFEGATLSSQIGQLKELEAVAFSWTGMIGSIPSEIGHLSKISFLGVGGNRFSGPLPSEMGLLTNMETLLAYTNQLSGTIPPELFQDLERLTYVDVDQNQFTGSLPTTVGRLTSLEQGLFYQNNMTGPIPSELGLLTSLTRLALFKNQIDGSICTELAEMSSLLTLELQDNLLSSSVPSELGAISMLTHLLLQNNRLTGSIALELWPEEGKSLVVFNAFGNHLDEEFVSPTNGSFCWANVSFNETECKQKTDNLELPVSCGCVCSC